MARKNSKGNKHVKKKPYMTLKQSFKDHFFVILERLDRYFEYIICDDKTSSISLDTADAMLHGCIFRIKSDADIFLDKVIRNKGFTSREQFNKKRRTYRVMSIKEMFNKFRRENEEREFTNLSLNDPDHGLLEEGYICKHKIRFPHPCSGCEEEIFNLGTDNHKLL